MKHTDPPKRILAIDPGIARVGYCVFNKMPIEYGTYFSSSEHKGLNVATIDALSQIFPKIKSIIESYEIDAIALEQVPSGVQMAQRDKVLALQSMMRTLAMVYEIPYSETNSRRLKNLFLKDGNAPKNAVKDKVKSVWGIDEKSADTNDAIMIAMIAAETPLSDEKVWWRWDKFFESVDEDVE